MEKQAAKLIGGYAIFKSGGSRNMLVASGNRRGVGGGRGKFTAARSNRLILLQNTVVTQKMSFTHIFDHSTSGGWIG